MQASPEKGAETLAPAERPLNARLRRWTDTFLGAIVTGFAFVIFAALVRAIVLEPLGTKVAFITFYPAVALAALFGGLRSGAVATLLSAAVVDYFWIPPVQSFAVPNGLDQLALAVFVFSGLLVSWIAERSKQADLAATQAEASRREEVERLVQQRTAELVRVADLLQAEIVERRAFEELFRQVIESAPNAMIMVEGGGKIELSNIRAEQIFGYSRQELLGRPIGDLLPARFQGDHVELHKAFFSDPAQRAMGPGRDLFALRKDGAEFPVEIGLSPIKTPEGVKIISSIVDISERLRMERTLSDRDQQLHLIFDNIVDHAILMLDAKGYIVGWNVGAERLKGYKKNEIMGMHVSLFYSSEDIADRKPELHLAIAETEGHVETEGWRRRRDGSLFTANMSLNAVRGPKGELQGFVSVTRDITERKRIESEMLATNERFALASEAAGIGFWDYDIETGKARWDDQMLRLYGVSRADADDRGLAVTYVHPDDRALVEAERRDAVMGARDFNLEYRIVQPSGRVRHLKNVATVKRDSKGRPVRLAGVTFDTTERNEAEHALELARDIAESANRAKTEFLAVMSHEIRTPLTSIGGFIDLLSHTDNLNRKQLRFIELVRTANSALLTVINDILDFSKVEAGQMETEARPFDLAKLVHDSVAIVRPLAQRKGLAMTFSLAPGAPARLIGDAARLRQVLLNLLNNAIKFTETGSIHIGVLWRTAPDALDRIRFEVSDTGIGIPAEKQGRLFKKFAQADSSIARQYGGTGLGLAICKRLVEHMGGEIGIVSSAGQGSTFWFTANLPVATPCPAAPEASEASAAPEVIAGCSQAARARLLLVDDTDTNREIIQAYLERGGYYVATAESAMEAFRLIEIETFDLILMDIQMPVMDGVAATQYIRSLPPPFRQIPIIALTGNVLPQQTRSFIEAGMDDHIGKPIEPAKLYEVIKRWLPAKPREDKSLASPFDREKFKEFVQLMGPADVGRLVGIFRERLDAAFQNSPEVSQREAHRLLTLAGRLGFRRFTALCQEIDGAPAGDSARLSALLDQARAARTAVIRTLEQDILSELRIHSETLMSSI